MMEFDDRYLSLMSLYKKLRRDPKKEKEAEKAFETAEALKMAGKVSEEAIETSRYI